MTEILIPKKNIILDATVFSTLMSCARLTDFRFNLDLVSINGKGNSLEAGILVHKILEWYYNLRIEGLLHRLAAEKSLNDIENYYLENDFPCVPRENTIGDNGHIKDVGFVYIVQTMDEYFKHHDNEQWIPIEVETVKQVIIYEDDECRIMWKTKFDLTVDTNNGIYPVDHKTMKQRRDSVTLNNQFMGQTLLLKSNGVMINKIGWQKNLKPQDKFTRAILTYSIDQLTEWSQIIVPFWAKQMLAYNELGFWPPNFTHCENKYGHCQFYKEVCSVNPNIREEGLRLNFVKGPKWDVSNVED